jgi:hypothetical protein
MPNLTLSIEEELLKRARMKALEQGTSVNELVRQYLAKFADDGKAERARREALIKEIDALAKQAGGGSRGRKWKREELYERVTRMTKK